MGVGGGLVGAPDSKRPQDGSGGGRNSEWVVTATDGRGAGIGKGTGRPKDVSGADVDRAEGWGSWTELGATWLWATEVAEGPRRKP
jgi:hypothetical protein